MENVERAADGRAYEAIPPIGLEDPDSSRRPRFVSATARLLHRHVGAADQRLKSVECG